MPKKSAAIRGNSLEDPKKVEQIELDPILPLPAVGKYPGVKQGEGEQILASTRLVVVELPYRVAWSLWEHVERRAAVEYPKYKARTDGLERHAHAQVEGVAAFRSAFLGEPLPILSEEDAQKIRDAQTKKAKKAKEKAGQVVEEARTEAAHDEAARKHAGCPKCKGLGDKKKTKSGEKIWKCRSCGHKWPRRSSGEAPESRSKGRSGPKQGGKAPKPSAATQRPRKRPAKND